LFESENSESLALKAIEILKNDSMRKEISRFGFEKAKSFDWATVGEQILSVYDLALTGNTKIKLNSEGRIWNRVRTND
jgi:phosphatidylinositol alpha-mannosyltransferase